MRRTPRGLDYRMRSDRRTLDAAKRLNIADETTKDIAEAVRDADLVMICTPVSTYGAIAEAMAPALKPGAILTDVGSVKESAVTAVMPHLPKGVHFVPGHPIAGTENSGPEAGFETLFEGRWFLDHATARHRSDRNRQDCGVVEAGR